MSCADNHSEPHALLDLLKVLETYPFKRLPHPVVINTSVQVGGPEVGLTTGILSDELEPEERIVLSSYLFDLLYNTFTNENSTYTLRIGKNI